MNNFHYWIVANTGASTAIDVQDQSETGANVDAKLQVERWLDERSLKPTDLTRFDLVSVTPA